MVILLIDQGAKVDIVDQQGQLALDIAKRGGLDGKENLKSELIKKIESKHQTTVQYTKLESFCCKKSPNQEIGLRRFSVYLKKIGRGKIGRKM